MSIVLAPPQNWRPIQYLRRKIDKRFVKALERRTDSGSGDPVLDILSGYPANLWKLNFSECRVQSQWAVRASGTCINPKGAMVTFEIYAPPLDAIYESGHVKVTVDTVPVYRRDWDGYELGPHKSVRVEVLKSPYWKWIESRYESNLCLLEEAKRNEMAEDAGRMSQLYGVAMNKL